MDEMGLSVCCLMCDAPDTPGTSRCRQCISRHSSARKVLFSDRAETGLEQLARRLASMIADPARFTSDSIHGGWMSTYHQALLKHQGTKQANTMEEIEEIFQLQRGKEAEIGPSSLSDRNPWSKRAPDDNEINEALEKLSYSGQRESSWWSELEEDIDSLDEGESD